jgi:hypothetical protein
VTTLKKDPILECTHKNTEQCHYTYVTKFTPSQEEVCEENYEKSCSITFKQQAFDETIRKCYKPTEKVCNGQGEEVCQTVYESSCTTKYVEKSPGKFVGDTGCEKLPVEICGAGCTFEEGPEECHDKTITSLVDAPEETCDLNPQKTCRFVTKLVPKLAPKHECTIVPREVCQLKFSQPRRVTKRLITRWCLDQAGPAPGESFTDVLSEPSELSSYQQDRASKTVQDKSFANLFNLRTDETPKQLNKFPDDDDAVITTEYPDYAYEYDYQDRLVEASDYQNLRVGA